MTDAENTEEASTEAASEGTTVESPVATASAPDRSDDDTETGVASASEQPDVGDASERSERKTPTK